jgi:hypothetical protein
VLTIKTDHKKVTANMVSFQFGSNPETSIQHGLVPIPKGEMKVSDPTFEEKWARGLIPVTLKTGEVMWVHKDVVNDEQWESGRPKSKGKSCNMISFIVEADDNIDTNALTDSEEKQFVLEAQPAKIQPTRTRSGRVFAK